MFEVGWTEMLVIAIVMIVVVGPKDLPNMLRTAGRMAAKLRGMAGDFQKQFNDALKEAELDDVKKSVDSLRGLSPMNEIRKQLNPFEQAAADVRSGLDTAMKPKPAEPSAPASAEPQPAEPLKNGATEMPGAGAPESAPAAPVFPAVTENPAAQTASAQPAKGARAPKAAKARTASSAAKANGSSPAKTNAAPKAAARPAAKAGPAKPTAKAKPAAKAAAAKQPAAAAKPAAAGKKTARPAR